MTASANEAKRPSMNLEELLNELLTIANKYDGQIVTPIKEVTLKNPDGLNGCRRIYFHLK
ncbi:hypothetical protein RZS08_28240 [Arthrospira platensis SPKY1]|nr:hypothetical protein [Arthrospira platensis SPKY1]